MAHPVNPRVKRAKPAPAIFAHPEAAAEPFMSGKATFPEPLASVAAMTDPAAASALIDSVAVPMIDTAADASATLIDAAETAAETMAAPVDAGARAETPMDTVTASVPDLVFPLSKGSVPMATAYDTAKTADMMGDLSVRAKGAMEKSVKFAEEMTEFTKGNVEAIVLSGRVAAKGIESMAQDAAETAKAGFEQAQTAMKSFTQVKSPTELFQLQSDYAKSAFDQLVANASRASEQMMKLMGDVAQPLSNRYALASEKVKSAAL